MKNWLLILALWILPVTSQADALICAKFFSLTTPTYELPVSTINGIFGEGKFFNETAQQRSGSKDSTEIEIIAKKTEDLGSRKKRLNEAITFYYRDLRTIRDKINELENFSETISNSAAKKELDSKIDSLFLLLSSGASGVTARASEYLSAKGVNHTLLKENRSSYYILINTKGDSFINQLAKRLMEKRNLEITIDPTNLLFSEADGLFKIINKNEFRIMLHPSILKEDSIYQNSTARHEYKHFLDAIEKSAEIEKPYHATIEAVRVSKRTSEALSGYDNFGVNEIRGYRESIVAMAHKAVTDPTLLHLLYPEIDMEVRTEIILSGITNKVFIKLDEATAKQPLHSTSWKHKEVTLDNGDTFKVSIENKNAKSTIEMSAFTRDLYSLIAWKLESTAEKSDAEKIQLLKNIRRVLSLHTIKELDDNYPSFKQINEILNEKQKASENYE